MRRFNREKLGALCRQCPLRDQPRVYGEAPGDKPPTFALVGESPGSEERVEGRCFVGAAGRFLNVALHEADLPRHRAHVTNLIACKPPQDDLSSAEGQEALRCCRPAFEAELRATAPSVRVIVPLGTRASGALGIEEGITKTRGSVYQRDVFGTERLVIPTFHPSFILRGNRAEEGTWVGDFKKVKDILANGWKPPRECFNTTPVLGDLTAFVKRAITSKALVAVDLETTGFRPESGRIVVIGLALDGETALSVPLLCQGGKDYWPAAQQNAVSAELRRLFSKTTTLYQNGLGVDLPFLVYNGFVDADALYKNPPHDVLLMHHVIHPELPHNLGYIVSVYGDTPYWKGEMLGREGRLLDVPDADVRTYNLRDAAVLHQVFGGLSADLEEFGLTHVYESLSRRMIAPVLEMQMTGMLVDTAALASWNRSIKARRGAWEKRVRDEAGVPSTFSLTSDDHLRWLVYGIEAPQFERTRSALAEYDDTTRKRPLRKDTKKYKDLVDTMAVLDAKPLYQPRTNIRLTESGKASVKEEYLVARKVACLNRLAQIAELKRKDASAERSEIQRTVRVLDALFSFNEADKLCSTYAKFPVWRDGRVHSSFKVHGTNTGRLASSAPNAQNIPEDARVVFVARRGWSLVGPDYSNLEVWVQAYDSGDEVMLATLLSGKNIHDETTKDLFGVTPSHPLWKPMRMASKKYRFGHLQYGGTLRSIYDKLMLEVPDLPLTFSALQRGDAAYLAKHPALGAWIERQTALCDNDPRIVENAFGRRRILLGADSEVVREALNTPIQGTGADIVNTAMIGMHAEFRANKMRARLVNQVHDQLVVECPDAELPAVKRIMKKHMQQRFRLWNRDVSFPVEMKWGKNWRDMHGGVK